MQVMDKSIMNNKLALPTIIATAIAIVPSAISAEGSGMITNAFGYLAHFINIGISDLVHCIAYNLIFPFIYGYINRVNYMDGEKFNYSKLLSDIAFKIVPVGWAVSILLFHVPRNVIMYYSIGHGFELWESSVISDVITTILFIPTRNYFLKYYEMALSAIASKVKSK